MNNNHFSPSLPLELWHCLRLFAALGSASIGSVEQQPRRNDEQASSFGKGNIREQAPCVGKHSKKAVRDCWQSSSFFGGKESVVFNETIASLDFFASFSYQEKNGGEDS